MQFTSSVISGSGRGKALGVPTFNLDLGMVPKELEEGVYAVRALLEHPSVGAKNYPATMHYGPRPTFGDTVSCEIHILEVLGDRFEVLDNMTVEVVAKLRDIQKFETAEELKKQMAQDGEMAAQILALPPKT
jgi:riboflavin kinase/FMN adenylyltransferase